MTAAATTRYQQKATALAAAWAVVFPGQPLTETALVLLLAVAELETNLGDWDRSHNWGGIMKRTLTAAEQATLTAAGITPSYANLATARAALPAGPNEILRVDSAPAPRGAYFVWSWAFPSDVAGATKFVQVLVLQRPPVEAILATATPDTLAAAMYATHYYEGNSTTPAANVSAYAANIAKHATAIGTALGGWSPGPAKPPAPSPAPNSGPGPGGTIAVFALLAFLTLWAVRS